MAKMKIVAMTSIKRKFLFQKNKISVKSILRLDTGKQTNGTTGPVEATRIWVGKQYVVCRLTTPLFSQNIRKSNDHPAHPLLPALRHYTHISI
jgi:hypothetical protein